MVISYTHQFIFFHVAKTAGMSVRNILAPYAQEPEKFKIKRPLPLLGGAPNPFYEAWEAWLLHARARDAQQFLPPSVYTSFYKFAFVRNPWDWQVSMYHFILQEPTHLKHALVKSFRNFERYLAWVIDTPNPYPKGATKLQKDVITDGEGKLLVDFVGHYETLTQDFAQVCQKLNITAQLPHVNKSTHHDYRAYYTDYTRQLVADHFAADIALFGYTFEGIQEASIK